MVEEAFPEERVAAVMVAAARAVMRVVRGVAVAKVASRALAMREAASTVAETEAVLEDQVAAISSAAVQQLAGRKQDGRTSRIVTLDVSQRSG